MLGGEPWSTHVSRSSRPGSTRPLVGEPLALDLLNTVWPEKGRQRDAFDEPNGVQNWLAERELEDTPGAEGPLREVRAILREVIERPSPAAERKLNEVLKHGWLRPVLRGDCPDELVEVDEPQWRPAWLAARDYLNLLSERPERIRRCAHPACTLYFNDTTRPGSRRWCTTSGCGNRAKAARHYYRARSG